PVVHLSWPACPLAMMHNWCPEKPQPAVLFCAHLGKNAAVIINGITRRNCGVVPTVVKKKFSSARFERAEIRIDGIHDCSDFFVDDLQVSIDIERAPIPVEVVVSDLK